VTNSKPNTRLRNERLHSQNPFFLFYLLRPQPLPSLGAETHLASDVFLAGIALKVLPAAPRRSPSIFFARILLLDFSPILHFFFFPPCPLLFFRHRQRNLSSVSPPPPPPAAVLFRLSVFPFPPCMICFFFPPLSSVLFHLPFLSFSPSDTANSFFFRTMAPSARISTFSSPTEFFPLTRPVFRRSGFPARLMASRLNAPLRF